MRPLACAGAMPEGVVRLVPGSAAGEARGQPSALWHAGAVPYSGPWGMPVVAAGDVLGADRCPWHARAVPYGVARLVSGCCGGVRSGANGCR